MAHAVVRRWGCRACVQKNRPGDHRGDGGLLIGLSNQVRRFRALPGQETFRKGGNKDHRDFERAQKFIDRVQPRASVGELNIGENEPGLLAFGEFDRLRMSARDTNRLMAKALDEALKIERDESSSR